MQQPQTRPHHGAPFVVPQPILNADRIGLQPRLHHRAVDVVVVAPALIAGVVGRVDKNAVNLIGVHRQQAFERMQVVALNNQVAV